MQGFAVASHLAASSPVARMLVTKHVAYAIPTVLLSLFSQSMVIFFFIGTGRLVKDEIAGYPEAERRAVLDVLSRLQAHDLAPGDVRAALGDRASSCSAAPCTRRRCPSWIHLAASMTAVAVHLWALSAEWTAFIENGRLMADPAAYVRKGPVAVPRPPRRRTP